jgi:hypothetical protein
MGGFGYRKKKKRGRGILGKRRWVVVNEGDTYWT